MMPRHKNRWLVRLLLLLLPVLLLLYTPLKSVVHKIGTTYP